MNKNNNKGAAESKWLSEKGPVDGGPEEAVAKKKGPAQVEGGKDQSAYDKIIQYGKDTKANMEKAAQQRRNDLFNAAILDSINLEKAHMGNEAKDIYGENFGQIEDGKYIGEKDTPHLNLDESKKKQILKDYKESEFYQGPGKMGYTQNFGPARQNGYAKGAAKVNEIMGKGASRQKYGGNKGDESRSKRDYEG